MEGELIVVSIVSGIFTIIGIMLLNRNWFKRQEMKYDFEKYKVRARRQGKKPPSNPKPTGIGDWIELFKGLDSDTIASVLDNLQQDQPDEWESILNHPLAKAFLQNLNIKQSQDTQESQGSFE